MTGLSVFGGFIYLFFLTIVGLIFNGYTLSMLWEWFVIPTFGAQHLPIVAAIGINLIVGLLTHHVTNHELVEEDDIDKEATYKRMERRTLYTVVRPSLILLFGYIAHLFM